MDRDRERDAADEDEAAPEGNQLRQKLKLVAHYAMLGFAPVVAVMALLVAIFSGNHSDTAQAGDVNARIDSLNASLQATRSELDNLKFVMSREKAMRLDERRKMEDVDEKIVQNVTRLQTKLKVAPTLEEQLRVAASAPVAAASVESKVPVSVGVSAPVAAEKLQAAPAPIPATAAQKPVAATPAPKADEKIKASAALPKNTGEKNPPAPVPKAEEKMSPQVKALKNAIDQYNKQ